MVDSRYSFRNETKFRNKIIYMVRYGTDTVSHVWPKIWKLFLPDHCKKLTTAKKFKIFLQFMQKLYTTDVLVLFKYLS